MVSRPLLYSQSGQSAQLEYNDVKIQSKLCCGRHSGSHAVNAIDGARSGERSSTAVGGLGAVVGGAGYSYGVLNGSYKWSTNRFLGNVATGAVIGGSFGTAGSIASGGARLVPSLTNAGANIWRANTVSANWGVNQAWRQSPVQNVQISYNTNQMNQQMLNQNLYGDLQRFANTQQNFQMPRVCPPSGPGFTNICGW